MFIVVQFPLADSRPFINSNTYRLRVPSWPLARPYVEFVRYTGPVERRKMGGIKYWSGEELYSRANRAIRFPDLGKKKIGTEHEIIYPQCAFWRFFSDGECVARTELAFRSPRHWYRRDENSLLKIIENFLSLPSIIPLPGNNIRCDLQSSGPYLAELYLKASTLSSHQSNTYIQNWWVKDGTPLIFIEYKKHEIAEIPKIATVVKGLKYGINLSHFWFDRNRKPIRIWILGHNGFNTFDVVRRLRLNLLRLHAEKESLKEIIRLLDGEKITIEPGTKASDRLQQYLNRIIRTISKKRRYGLPHNNIFEASFDSEEIVSEGEFATIRSQIKKIRISIARKVENHIENELRGDRKILVANYSMGDINFINGTLKRIGKQTMTNISVKLGDGTTFYGDFVVAKNIEDSFNKAEQSQVGDELKDNLKKLSSLVAKLCEKLPEDKTREVGNDLQTFVNEATSEKPRKKWYELSAEGLIEAARTVSIMAGPIVTTVKTILSLIG